MSKCDYCGEELEEITDEENDLELTWCSLCDTYVEVGSNDNIEPLVGCLDDEEEQSMAAEELERQLSEVYDEVE